MILDPLEKGRKSEADFSFQTPTCDPNCAPAAHSDESDVPQTTPLDQRDVAPPAARGGPARVRLLRDPRVDRLLGGRPDAGGRRLRRVPTSAAARFGRLRSAVVSLPAGSCVVTR